MQIKSQLAKISGQHTPCFGNTKKFEIAKYVNHSLSYGDFCKNRIFNVYFIRFVNNSANNYPI